MTRVKHARDYLNRVSSEMMKAFQSVRTNGIKSLSANEAKLLLAAISGLIVLLAFGGITLRLVNSKNKELKDFEIMALPEETSASTHAAKPSPDSKLIEEQSEVENNRLDNEITRLSKRVQKLALATEIRMVTQVLNIEKDALEKQRLAAKAAKEARINAENEKIGAEAADRKRSLCGQYNIQYKLALERGDLNAQTSYNALMNNTRCNER